MIVDPTSSQTSVTGAIRQAARLTGADFQYLLATAQVESNLSPNARAGSSSATGLFQFIEQTWLATLKEFGPALGYGAYADAIGRQPSGAYAVMDPRMTERIMNLRSDPAANAVMAGAFTRSNATALAARLGREPSEGELYIAHFLGAGGAGRLIEYAANRPATPGAEVFPNAARSNPSIFYDRQGRARSIGDVYQVLVGRYQTARVGTGNALAKAEAKSIPDPAQFAETYQAANGNAEPTKPLDDGPLFQSLFQTGARREAVSPMVSALWSAPAGDTVLRNPAEGRGGLLDLFQDGATDGRALFASRG